MICRPKKLVLTICFVSRKCTRAISYSPNSKYDKWKIKHDTNTMFSQASVRVACQEYHVVRSSLQPTETSPIQVSFKDCKHIASISDPFFISGYSDLNSKIHEDNITCVDAKTVMKNVHDAYRSQELRVEYSAQVPFSTLLHLVNSCC